VERTGANWEKYFERWGLSAVKYDVLKPRLTMTESELNRMPFEQVLVFMSKIIEEDVCKYKDQKEQQSKQDELNKKQRK